jgi:glycopeptide antibiotics resistance protein
MERRDLSLWAIVCSTAVILFVLLPLRGFDPGGHWDRVAWIPFVSRPIGVFDVIGNLLLFMPLGASIAWHARRSALLRVATVAFVCSLFGEWSQIYSRYRFPATQDILLNVTGTVIAAYAVDCLRRRRSGKVEAGQTSGVRKRVKVTYRAQTPPLIDGRGQARVD